MRKTKCSIILYLILIVIVSLIPLNTVRAEQTHKSRVVRVACGMNDTLYLDEQGDPQGLSLPYLRQLAWNYGWTLEYVEGSYSESLKNLNEGKVDLMFPVSKEDNTDGNLVFADYVSGYQQIGLFAKKDADIFYEDYEGFNNAKVGISIGSNSEILDTYSADHEFDYVPVELNTVQDKIDALEKGEVDLVAFSTLNNVPNGKLVAVLDQVPIYYCTTKTNQELLNEINNSMRMQMVNTPDLAADLFLQVLKGNNKISFTKEENQKIESIDKVTFGVYSDCLPLAGIDSKGECVGIYVDLLKLLAEESGLNIEIIPIKDSNKLYSYMDDGTVDFVIGVQELRFYSKNADNYLASNGLTNYTTVAVSMPEYRFDEDESPVIALTKDRNYLEDYIYSNYPKASIKYMDNRKDCLDAVQNGKASATFINTWEYNYETKNPRYQELMEWESMRINSVVGLGGMKQSDLELLSILEKTISQVPQDKVEDIIATNLNISYDSYNLKDRLYEIKNELIIIFLILLIVFVCLGIYLNVKKKYIKDLVIANNTKANFLSRMSHELRTPLNAINGYASITTDGAQKGNIEKEEILDNMNSIQKASGYLLGIIKDILDVQRMETGKISLDIKETNPNEYMNIVVNMIQPMADDKHIKFTYNMLNGSEYNYMMDGLRVEQVLFNLLYNAIKFTPEGGNVTMTSELVDMDDRYTTIKFVIADTGIGMSKEFVDTRLFQKFAQENQDITSPYAGCGNGLAICKELVKLMGGEISCVSEQGKGSIFSTTIKVEYIKPAPIKKKKYDMSIYDLSGTKVLLCEDNPMNQKMEKRLLEKMNCNVEIAEDGQVGLDKFMESDIGYYSVVLMDIRMPNMDGLEATRKIRVLQREDAKKVPIIAVSANAFEDDVKKSLEVGMNEHLAKPVDARVLYAKIKEYCYI